jgi:hypothetical protein
MDSLLLALSKIVKLIHYGWLQDIKPARAISRRIEGTLFCVISHPLLRIYCIYYDYTSMMMRTEAVRAVYIKTTVLWNVVW